MLAHKHEEHIIVFGLALVEMVCSTMFACALSLFAKQLTLISLLFGHISKLETPFLLIGYA